MTDPTSDVAAALEAAQDHADVIVSGGGWGDPAVIVRRTDRETETIDLERFLPEPARQRGTVTVYTAEGFVEAYHHRTGSAPDSQMPAVVYADPDACRLVAVLNDDAGTVAGWRDHRIRLDLKPTPEWLHWAKHEGLGPQERFAEVVEGGEREIVDPSATAMLDIAQTFHATIGAKVKRHNRLRDGRTQLIYDEDIDASAGASGEVEIPDKFTVQVRPFYGAEPRFVECRLRYRADGGGEFAIGYSMVRPDEVKREAFAADVVGHVREQLPGTLVVDGIPADATRAGR